MVLKIKPTATKKNKKKYGTAKPNKSGLVVSYDIQLGVLMIYS